MRRILAWALGSASLAALFGGQTHADTIVVATCGTLPNQLAVGTVGNNYMDINGNMCTNATGGVGTTVAISQVTPGTTNAVTINDAAGNSATNTTSHSVNVNVVNNGVAAGTSAVSASYAPVALLSQSNCNAQALTTAQLNPPTGDLKGNMCAKVLPQVNAMVSGTATVSATATNTLLVTSVASQSLYITGYSCSNTGTSNSLVNFEDGNGGATIWNQIVPSGGGANIAGMTPLFKTSSGNGLYYAIGTASTSVLCNAAGFSQ